MNRVLAIAAVAFVLSGAAGFAQSSSGPGQTPVPGFSVEGMLAELSIFLPENLAGFSRGARQGPAAAGQQGGAGQQAGQQGGQRGGFSIQRDPKLFFTAQEVNTLVPLLQALRDNPFPTPSGAKKLQATVDGILTAEQKSARDAFHDQRVKAAAERQQNDGGQNGGGFANLRNMTPDERQRFLQTLPPETRQRIEARLKQEGGTGPQLTPIQRRQLFIDNFIQSLQRWKKDMGR